MPERSLNRRMIQIEASNTLESIKRSGQLVRIATKTHTL
jgi:hypothetical protein